MVNGATHDDTSKEGNGAQERRHHQHRHGRAELSLGTRPPPTRSISHGRPRIDANDAWNSRSGSDNHTRMSDATRVSQLAAHTPKATHKHPHSDTRRNVAAVPTVRSRRSGDRRDPTSPTTHMAVGRKHAASRPCCRTSATLPPNAPKSCSFHPHEDEP